MLNIDFPYRIDRRGFTAATDYDEHVRDMIEQLLFTNMGERVNRPTFGSGLLQLVFAPNSPELAAALQFTVKAALQTYLGDVMTLQTLDISSQDSTLRVGVKYTVTASGNTRTDTFVRSGN